MTHAESRFPLLRVRACGHLVRCWSLYTAFNSFEFVSPPFVPSISFIHLCLHRPLYVWFSLLYSSSSASLVFVRFCLGVPSAHYACLSVSVLDRSSPRSYSGRIPHYIPLASHARCHPLLPCPRLHVPRYLDTDAILLVVMLLRWYAYAKHNPLSLFHLWHSLSNGFFKSSHLSAFNSSCSSLCVSFSLFWINLLIWWYYCEHSCMSRDARVFFHPRAAYHSHSSSSSASSAFVDMSSCLLSLSVFLFCPGLLPLSPYASSGHCLPVVYTSLVVAFAVVSTPKYCV